MKRCAGCGADIEQNQDHERGCKAGPCDPEDACMHEAGTSKGCCERATRFHARPGEYTDEILCDVHAAGKVTEPLTTGDNHAVSQR